ncbi:hypothetical protein DFH09DRAFT_1088606 [Mycena vulgaris]|nr:hypothetical protein DFH09DRAFT_1088606 [Mycena vulgaris]
MPPPKGPIWDFFFPGVKQNSAHSEAYCLGCIRHFRQVQGIQDPPNDTDSGLGRLQWEEDSFAQARVSAGHVRGVKESMIAHLIGSRPCPHASATAKSTAKKIKTGKGKAPAPDSDADDESDPQPASKKRKAIFRSVDKAMKQPELQVYRGANIPFSAAEVERLRVQFLRATVSANLPFLWTEDVEIIKLFIMFRSTACDVLPARDVISGTLLNNASAEVEKNLRAELKTQYVVLSSDGWKDDSRNPITGVNVTSNTGSSYLVDLIQSNGHKKDGASIQRGRKDLALKRAWLLVAPCCAHQSELMLGDYLAVHELAADIAAEATDLIHWIIGHDRVRKIFDDTQFEKNFKVLVYLVANITRWTTHYLAFQRILLLKIPLRHAAYLRRQEIIAAQVGAEKNRKAIEKMTDMATTQLDLIENNEFWASLQMVVDDVEPLCYATNINQANRTRPDQVLLTFAGLFRHFAGHPNRVVAKGMMERIEKLWTALDQPLFVLCLVLNPYESLERFGDKAGINVFVLNTELIAVFISSPHSDEVVLKIVFDSSSAVCVRGPGIAPARPQKMQRARRQYLLPS